MQNKNYNTTNNQNNIPNKVNLSKNTNLIEVKYIINSIKVI
jgi:hypothetical protein